MLRHSELPPPGSLRSPPSPAKRGEGSGRVRCSRRFELVGTGHSVVDRDTRLADQRAAVGTGQPFVRIQGVGKNYRTKGRSLKALDPISLELANGEFISVVGPSGCGKSTLMMLVAGLIPATSGQIVIE